MTTSSSPEPPAAPVARPAAGPETDAVESDWTWTANAADWIPPDVDTSRPSAARMYDFALGGKDNFEVDREAVIGISSLFPDFQDLALANRGFLVRGTASMAGDGVDQFIDLGAGIPTSPNVHEVAQQLQPGARVVYVDNDPIVMAHSRALRGRFDGVRTAAHDLRHPEALLTDARVTDFIDFERPVGLMFIAVLHFVRADLAPQILARYRRGLAPGSQILISAACADGTPTELISKLENVYADSATPIVFRSRSQIEELVEGMELLEPGFIDVTSWRDDGAPTTVQMLGGLARVP